ncbi:Olfactory receptor 2G3, partial [Galemys pyrenaicus]
GMGITNSSAKEEFILVGFSDQPHLEKILFGVVLVSYLLTLVGNTVIILISSIDPKLKTPMYFFLSHLSLVDLCFTTSVVPQLLWNIKGPTKTITFLGCVVQLYVSLAMGSAECVLLVAMAFDRYAAVCKPLHYATMMSPRVCKALAGVVWLCGIGNSLIQCTVTLQLPRCGHRWIYNFFCEVPSMMKLACVDIHANEVQMFIASLVLLFLPLSLIMMSYGFIVRAVVKIKSSQAWHKLLGTCGSHLTVVFVFYGTALVIYVQPNSSFSHTHGKFISLFYTVVTPTFNPLIYTLRNKDEEFILVGFSDQPHLEKILFGVVLVSYLLTLVGNTVIILISSIDPKLKTPMYFFLSHLSLVDLCFTASVVPQLLWNLKGPTKTITFLGCMVQLYVSLAMGSAECVLLVVMAFDRYAAVCKPLHYATVMSPRVCKALTGVAWLCGIGNSLIQSTLTLLLPRCGHRWIYNFVCEVPSMIKLACVNVHANEVQVFVASLVLLFFPLSLIVMSYGFIVRAVVRLKSAQAWRKVLGTCGSHLTVVSLFYGTALVIYGQPNSSFSHTHGKFISLFYTVVTPTLNPLIYTLRNKDVKGALRRTEILLASLFLVLYMVALTGNILIITATSMENSLHSPMYFFMKHLSFLDLCYISVMVPRSIYNSFMHSGYISLMECVWGSQRLQELVTATECIAQCFAFILCITAETFMLTVMSYDCYMAICLPLCHKIIMDVGKCVHSVLGMWISGTISGVMQTAATFSMHFCGSQIHQFFCDSPQLLKLSCSNEYISDIGVTAFVAFISCLCVTFIRLSYIQILSTVLKIVKAFFTCLPHLVVIILFISTASFEFLKSPTDSPSALDIFLTIMYTVVPPTLNPMIYSLRNKAVKAALRKVFQRRKA